MTSADLISLAALAFASWATGFGTGLIVAATRKFTEKL